MFEPLDSPFVGEADFMFPDCFALPSEKSEHQSYLQGLTGMYINIDFPFLNDLRAEGRLVTIESALLRLYPVKGTYGEQYPLPESLTLYTADENNVTEDVVTDIQAVPYKPEAW